MNILLFFCLPFLLIVPTSFNYKHTDPVINYLNTDEIIKFNKKEYKLAYSSHPVSNYYMQEYIPKNETLDRYEHMILVDYLLIDTPAANIIGVKINEIKERKKTDMVANYELVENKETKEYILDFLLSSSKYLTVNVIEWNGYHYKNYTDKAGHKGVLLFGVSERAYDGGVTWYLKTLKGHRFDWIKELSLHNFPNIQVN
ncbi:MAG TPA: hypothetical protein VK668_01185 [Mucilaginibacter sp.]|nr:hypothetical protein [Mucilaginibacter sp.]